MADETAPVFKDYDVILAERRESSAKEGPSFKLGGEVWKCKRRMNAGAAIALMKVANTNDPDEMFNFMKFVLVGGKVAFARFEALFKGTDNDDDGDYDVEVLGDIIVDLVQGYSGRPTVGS